MTKFPYCSQCGKQSVIYKIPDNDTMHRHVCSNCHVVFYENPKVVVGAVTTYEDAFLLCKRAIEPRKGYWTYPAGYLENQESLEEATLREAREEAGISIKITRLLGTYSLLAVNQIHIIYAAEMINAEYSPGHESLEIALFKENEIPWDKLAFPVIRWALNAYIHQIPGSIDSKTARKSFHDLLSDE